MMNGRASSIEKTSDEKRLTIRPMGVMSKKEIGACN